MTFRTAISVVALFVVGALLFASDVGLVDAFIMMTGFALLGLLLREFDNSKRAKGRPVESDE